MSAVKQQHTPWTAERIGGTGFVDDVDIYAVRDSRGREIFTGTEDMARLLAAAPTLLAALHEVEAYLEDREDVVDGGYGEPAPNKEMTLLREVRAALSKAGV